MYGAPHCVPAVGVVRMAAALPSRVFRRLKRGLLGLVRKTAAHLCSTYPPRQDKDTGRLAHRFAFMDAEFVRGLSQEFPDYPPLVFAQTEQALAHCFDLLGSGPVVVKRGMQCAGVGGVLYSPSAITTTERARDGFSLKINRSNRSTARYVWSLLGDAYVPIDWQLDFKSGYRWREDVWHGDIRFGHLRGVDVKVPWELARMQHLPTLAMAAHFSRCGLPGFRQSEIYARKFRNQVLDFIASNPPGFGVNWACPMDVAIRAANWLVARDIFVASGVVFGDDFESIFLASVTAHARHIASNLEWAPKHRGNHYLANIVGLMLIAIYLPSSSEVDRWLLFAVSEFFAEIDYQFHPDGSNFEGSVCYHRLSAEMISWGIPFLMNLSDEKANRLSRVNVQKSLLTLRGKMTALRFYTRPNGQGKWPIPPDFWERLRKIGDFTVGLTKPDGLVVQFGDNDSGRFVTLGSREQLLAANDSSMPIWSLDHSSLVAGINALLGPSTSEESNITDVAAKLRLFIAGQPSLRQYSCEEREIHWSNDVIIGTDKDWLDGCTRYEDVSESNRWLTTYECQSLNLLEGLKLIAFTGMGCYIFRGDHLYLAVRCGEIGLAGLGGHSHCDQLAIELTINRQNLVRDPGTFIYTPLPEKRNAYRSALAHHVPRVRGKEPADLNRGIFDLRSSAPGECLYFGPNGFVGRHRGFGSWIYRLIEVKNDRVVIKDFSNGDLLLDDPSPHQLKYSQSYGRQMPH